MTPSTVRTLLVFLAIPFVVPSPAPAEEPPKDRGFPDGLRRFNGLLVGRLVDKDVEAGTFRVEVDRVSRVWRGSKAERPKSVVGRTIAVEGVFGKWLDVLLLLKKGETLEFEAKHDGGDKLRFPGELLRKVAPVKPGDYPDLPDAFRGFEGAVVCRVVRKDEEMLEAIVEVTKILDVWKKNRAKKPESVVGKKMILAGFWKHKDFYHKIKKGDRLETGLRHHSRQSDHLSVHEFVRKAGDAPQREPENEADADGDDGRLPKGLRGFNGMLVGRLREKDVERGSFSVDVDRVARVWRNSKAKNPKCIVGKAVTVQGVTGKWLDVLLLTKKGETLQFESRDDGGEKLTFPGEFLRKVPPVKPGDFPELPDAARGFRGRIAAKIVKKDAEALELVVEVLEVSETGEESKAKKAASLVSRRAMLGGFWWHKKAYSELRVGDVIEMTVRHTVWHTDHLSLEKKPGLKKRNAD